MHTYQRGADIYWQMGQLQDAFTIYDRIVRMAPGDVDARQQLIHLYITTGRLSDATESGCGDTEEYAETRRQELTVGWVGDPTLQPIGKLCRRRFRQRNGQVGFLKSRNLILVRLRRIKFVRRTIH